MATMSKLRPARARAVKQHNENFERVIDGLSSLSFNRLRKLNVSRCQRWHPPSSQPWLIVDWSNAIAGEAGELANVVKKIRRQQTGARHDKDPQLGILFREAADEIADVVIYCDLMAEFLGVDLAGAIRSKFNRTSRKYGFPEQL